MSDPVTDEQLRSRLGEALVTPEAYDQLILQSSSMLFQGLVRSGRGQGTTAKKVAAMVAEALPRDEVSTISAKVYEECFTREELQALLAFYESKTGAKLVKLQSEMGQEVGTRVSGIVTQRWPGLARKHGLDSGR